MWTNLISVFDLLCEFLPPFSPIPSDWFNANQEENKETEGAKTSVNLAR